ncbi:MAG: ATP-binding protein [Chloroflexota bacterium]
MAKRVDEILRRLNVPQPRARTEPVAPAEEVCPKCKGAGFVSYDVPYGHPLFGRAFECECLTSRRETQTFDELQQLSDLINFRDRTFEAFNPKVAGVAEAFRLCREYAEDPRGWLILVGPVGCGKTHLAAATANRYLAVGGKPFFVNVPELLDHLRATYAPSSTVSYDERFEEVRNAELLILDDLGTESGTEWAKEKIYQIFNHRYNTEAPTMVTMNPKEYKRLDERVMSRMRDSAMSRVVEMRETEVQDYRPRKGRKR